MNEKPIHVSGSSGEADKGVKDATIGTSNSFACLETCGAVMSEGSTGSQKVPRTHSEDESDILLDNNSDESEVLSEQQEEQQLNLNSLFTFNYKASGHHLMFRTNDGKIAKESTHEEERFYTAPEGKLFSSFTAQYAGTGYLHQKDIQLLVQREHDEAQGTEGSVPTRLEESGPATPSSMTKRKKFILLRDVINGFKKPCVLDIKMGIRGYGLNATPVKRRNKIKKMFQTTSSTLGFRIHGMKRWDAASQSYIMSDKYVGRGLGIETMKGFLSRFFVTQEEPDYRLAEIFHARLNMLSDLFEDQEVFHFYTSSLLLYFDHENPYETADVKMIDFAFSYPVRDILKVEPSSSLKDEGYLFGLRNLTRLLSSITSCTSFTPYPAKAIKTLLCSDEFAVA